MTKYRTLSLPVFALTILLSGSIGVPLHGTTWDAGFKNNSAANPATQGPGKTSPFSPLTLTSEDMTLIAAAQTPQMQTRLASDKVARKDFAKNIRELLSVADEAWASGMGERPEVKRQWDLMRQVVLAEAYFKTQPRTGPGELAKPNISESEVEQFFAQPGNQAKFEQFLKDAQVKNPQLAGADLPADQVRQVKQQLGEVLIGAQRGTQAGIDQKRSVQLQILMEQARALASIYAQEQLIARIKATDQEIDGYIRQHPEFDVTQLRATAEAVLKRARAGEDFAKLAQEFSIEAATSDSGGDLGWFGPGEMVAEFEAAAFALQPGQISEVVETQFGFHIIKLEGIRMQTTDGKPGKQVWARHILMSSGARANSTGPRLSPREQVRNLIEQEKQTRLIDEIVSRSSVTVAEDFRVEAPPPTPQDQPKPLRKRKRARRSLKHRV